MKVHFVCSGNLYRSIMAEAYLKSKHIPGFIVSSSGTRARDNLDENAKLLTRWILTKEHLVDFRKGYWERTTKEVIEDQDFVVFMRQEHYDYCVSELHCVLGKHVVWDVLDRSEKLDTKELEDEKAEQFFTKEKFQEIKLLVDSIIDRLQSDD